MGTRFSVWERDGYAIGYAIFLHNSLIIKGGTRFTRFYPIFYVVVCFFSFFVYSRKRRKSGKIEKSRSWDEKRFLLGLGIFVGFWDLWPRIS